MSKVKNMGCININMIWRSPKIEISKSYILGMRGIDHPARMNALASWLSTPKSSRVALFGTLETLDHVFFEWLPGARSQK